MASMGTKEKIVSYTTGTPMPITFTLDEDFSGDVVVWYELPEMYVNQKRYIENKPGPIWDNIMAKYTCEDAETIDDFRYRRGDDTAFMTQVEQAATASGGKVHPCGLVSLSMFTDRYELSRVDPDTAVIELDESDLSFESEDFFWEDRLLETGNPFPRSVRLKDEGDVSWLETAADVEHYKVWTRTPPSPHVRQLWATINGGLQAGTYSLNVIGNSPSFTDMWKVPEKRFILSETHTLGSAGAGQVFGVLCIIFGVLEIVMTIVIVVVPEGKRPTVVPFR
mmetsp:Transcript_11431/g.26426  ORF Transcript_11431/g.26426 Transcript_11431/m.26426 type:complete len:280 (-) Transcript_11431:75-914(-)